MDPQILHLNHPQQDALLLGGVVIVLIATFLLAGGQQPTEAEVLTAANSSQNVTAFIQQHAGVTATVDRTDDGSYTVRYTAGEGSTLRAAVDMGSRTVTVIDR